MNQEFDSAQHRKAYQKDYQAQYRRTYLAKKKRLSVTLELVEFERLQMLAAKENTTEGRILAKLGFCYLDKKYYLPWQLEEQLSLFIQNCRAIGNNINQLAHHANAVGRYDHELLLKHVMELEIQVRNFLTRPLG